MRAPDSRLAVVHCSLSELQSLGSEVWADAVAHFSYRRFPAGSHMLEAGRVVSDLYFLTSGIARFYYLKTGGKEFNKGFSTTGQVLSSVSSLVKGDPSPFYVQALVACECVSISYLDFLELSEKHPDWNRLRIRLLESLVIKKEGREADFLLLSAAERYQNFLQEYAHIAGSIPNYHVASYLGITEVALSRIRRRLRLTRVNVSGGE